MLAEYKNKANLGIGVGFLLSIAGGVTAVAIGGDQGLIMGSLIRLGGAALFIWGCVMYSLGKGRSGWWGAFGLLSLIGLIVLVCLKDRSEKPIERRGFPVIPPKSY